MRKNLAALFAMLFILVLLVWALFYTIISRQIRADAESRAQLVAGQIVDSLGAKLAELEQVSILLSGNDSVVRFTQETDPAAYYRLADEVNHVISTSRADQNFIGNMIVYGTDGSFYRFSGTLSNTSCTRVGYLAGLSDQSQHLTLRLEYRNYIGYASTIADSSGNRTGTLVMLVEEERILELIRELALGDSLMVSVSARDEVITTNLPEGRSDTAGYIVTHHIGLTPFEITVSASNRELLSSTYYFSVAALVTAALFGLLILVFVHQMNRRFVSPMLRVMDNVEALDWAKDNSFLPAVQSEEFDTLIERINEMLLRIERQSKAIKSAELRAASAELQKQKAIIVSLKKQINAHFVINTLSTIQVLVEQGDTVRAEGVATDLSALVRYAYAKDDMIGLWNELQMLERYIRIMNVRYSNKIDVCFEADDRLMDTLIPRMLLQPMVENAIVHGFKNRREGCQIQIHATLEGSRAVIAIEDNGIGMDPAAVTALNHSLRLSSDEPPEGIDNIALINIKRQLQAHYGEDASLEIQSELHRGSKILLTFPHSGYPRET
ncbi:histidine kinase [Ruminococcaceae bacterium OttesenSCG-928-L11]|nr:histidine kinase [Ruminococcaceae bacterium OttesenSCG-928-L11]